MADRQTGSIWTHYGGSVLQGPLAGQGIQLEMLPTYHTTWSQWRDAYPDTLVLDWYPEFANRYRPVGFEVGGASLGPDFRLTILNWDDRLPESELVLGVNHHGEQRAYVLADMDPGPQVIANRLSGDPIVIFADPDDTYALAFVAVLDGAALEFRVADGVITDQYGVAWDLSGHALGGDYAGRQLPFATSFVSEWYGWSAYFPETSIYRRLAG